MNNIERLGSILMLNISLVRRPNFLKGVSWQWALLLGLVSLATALGGSILLQNRLEHSIYVKGASAYQAGDCNTALFYFGKIPDQKGFLDFNNYDEWANTRAQECYELQELIELISDLPPHEALAALSQFLTRHEGSFLKELIQQQAEEIFQQYPLSNLINQSLCSQLKKFSQQDLLSQYSENIVSTHITCGEFHVKQQHISSR
jgi:hypothetical protein